MKKWHEKNIQFSFISFFRFVSLVYSYFITRDVLIFKILISKRWIRGFSFFMFQAGICQKKGFVILFQFIVDRLFKHISPSASYMLSNFREISEIIFFEPFF